MEKKPVVEQDECVGCGNCEEVCPEVFRLNEDGVAEVHDPEGAAEDKIRDAIESCPVQCISWVDT